MNRTLAICLFAAAAAAAGTPRLTFQSPPDRLEDVVAGIVKTAGAALEVDGDLRDAIVAADFRDVSPRDAAERLAAAAGAALHVTPDGTIRLVPAWKAPLLAQLDAVPEPVKPGMVAEQRPIDLKWFRSVTGLSCTMDAELRGVWPVAHLDPAGRRASELLERIAERGGLAWDLRYGVLFLAKAERLATLPRALPQAPESAETLNLLLENTPLPKAAETLGALSGVEVVLAQEVRAMKISVHATGVTLAQALALMAFPNGLEAEAGDGRVVLRPAPTFTFDGAERTVEEILGTLGVAVDVDARYRGAKVALACTNATAPRVLDLLAGALGAGRYDGRLLPEWKREIHLKLERGADLTLEAKGALADVLRRLGREAGVPVVLDPRVDGRQAAELHVAALKGAMALALVTEPRGLQAELRYGVVLVGEPGPLLALPEVNPFDGLGLPQARTDLAFRRTPLREALLYLGNVAGIPVAPASGAHADVAVETVTLKADGVAFPDALALTLFPLGFTAEVDGGRVLVKMASPE